MKKYSQLLSWIMMVIACIAVVAFYQITTKKLGAIYEENTQLSIYEQKKIFLKDTVNNQIARIEEKKQAVTADYQERVQNTAAMFRVYQSLGQDKFPELFQAHFTHKNDPQKWTAVLWMAETGTVLFDPTHLVENSDPEATVRNAQNDFAAFQVNTYGDYRAFFGIKKAYVNQVVKEYIADEIRNSNFVEGAYIWVNEVVNYEGGDNYAIRRVHPNLPETEGIYLSTKMTDVKGNMPYLEELEGVKKNGEIFFTYYFKKLDSDVVTKKLSYAKLYKDFDWIIAMGIYLDDMQVYIDKANTESELMISNVFPQFVALLLVLLLSTYAIAILLEKRSHTQNWKALEEKMSRDALTNAFTRRAGDDALKNLFSGYQKDEANPAIIMIDIDDFKVINDTYGHDAGDQTLKNVAHTIKAGVRSTDKTYRWGGDEFVLVCDGITPVNVLDFCTKIVHAVAAMENTCGESQFKTTISMGATYFKKSDTSYSDALKRADRALYISKLNGNNQVNVEF